jgi:hypothetical protein
MYLVFSPLTLNPITLAEVSSAINIFLMLSSDPPIISIPSAYANNCIDLKSLCLLFAYLLAYYFLQYYIKQ